MIGKGGSKLKSIGAAARKEIESLLGTRVYLELHVIVEENWRESRYFVDSLDWRKQLEDLANAKPAAEERAGESMKPVKKTGRAARFGPADKSSVWASPQPRRWVPHSSPVFGDEWATIPPSKPYSRTLMPRLFILRYR